MSGAAADLRRCRWAGGDTAGRGVHRLAGGGRRAAADRRPGQHDPGTASSAQNVGPLSALAVGGYIVLAGLWSSPVSGASMNPARSFGPALVTGDFSAYWVYLAGPLLGGAIAVGMAFLLRGRGGDAGGRAAARGELQEAQTIRRAVPPPRAS